VFQTTDTHRMVESVFGEFALPLIPETGPTSPTVSICRSRLATTTTVISAARSIRKRACSGSPFGV